MDKPSYPTYVKKIARPVLYISDSSDDEEEE